MDTIAAILNSEFVVTDSGGVQKESYFLKKMFRVKKRNRVERINFIKFFKTYRK